MLSFMGVTLAFSIIFGIINNDRIAYVNTGLFQYKLNTTRKRTKPKTKQQSKPKTHYKTKTIAAKNKPKTSHKQRTR